MAFEGGRIRRRAVVALSVAVVGGGSLAAAAVAADLGSESPQQVLKATAAAIRSSKGYELQAVIHQGSSTERLGMINSGSGNFAMTVSEGQRQGTAQILLVDHKSYMKASVAFWVSQGVKKSEAQQLAPHWFKTPSSEFAQLVKGLGKFSPSTLAQCISEGHGPLSNLGPATVNGQSAVVLKDAGGVPGSGPGTLAVAASGQPYPLRITETGPTRAGGKINACNDGKADNSTGTVTMSHWNSPPAVAAPAGAITIPKNGGSGGSAGA